MANTRIPVTDSDVITSLRMRQGERTQKELAQEIGISKAYLSDVLNNRRHPGETILKYLGVRKIKNDSQVVRYEPERSIREERGF